MSAATVSLWRDDRLEARDDCDVLPATIEAADSWLVDDGTRARARPAPHAVHDLDPARAVPAARSGAFWDAALAAIPRTGAWFPRVELRTQLLRPQLLFRLREAPELKRSDRAAHPRADATRARRRGSRDPTSRR